MKKLKTKKYDVRRCSEQNLLGLSCVVRQWFGIRGKNVDEVGRRVVQTVQSVVQTQRGKLHRRHRHGTGIVAATVQYGSIKNLKLFLHNCNFGWIYLYLFIIYIYLFINFIIYFVPMCCQCTTTNLDGVLVQYNPNRTIFCVTCLTIILGSLLPGQPYTLEPHYNITEFGVHKKSVL